MKPRNFPARRLLRQLDAKARKEKRGLTVAEQDAIDAARDKRTKKRRSA